MNYCTDASHADGAKHTHSERECGWGKIGNAHDDGHDASCYSDKRCSHWNHEDHWEWIGGPFSGEWVHKDNTDCLLRDNGNYYPVDVYKCPDYGYTCGKEEYNHDNKKEVSFGWGVSANLVLPCTHGSNNEQYKTRMASAKGAVENLVSSLPNTAIVSYVSYTTDYNYETGKWNKDLIDVSQDLDKLNLEPYGGTNTDKGLEAGINRFSDSNVSKKILVLVTDGEVSDGYGYKPSNYNKCDFDLYTVGFTYSNQKLEDLTKGEGEYFRADDDATLKVAFDEMKTRISAMIVDPMGDKVDYQKNAADAEGSVKGSFTTIGSTLYWIPKETTEIPAGSTIKYTYTVKLNGNASREDGDYTKQVPLNGETYLQYGIEKGDKKEACKTEYEVPVGSYKVSTLTESFEDMDGKTINEATPHPEQHEITDFSQDSSLTVYGAPQSIATSDPHERYVYLYSTLNGDRINEGDADENGSYATFADYDMNVYDQAEAYKLVHVYKLEQVNSVSYEYKDAPADLNPDPENLPETQWFEKGSVQTCMENPTSDKYNFSGWTVKSGEVTVNADGTFELTDDVVFEGSWTIKPNYRIVANYYTVTDGDVVNAHKDNEVVMPLGDPVYEDSDAETEETVGGEYYRYGGESYTKMELGEGNPTGVTVSDSTVYGIVPTATEKGTVIIVNFYRYKASDAYYTVTHKYFNVTPDGIETEVTGDGYTTDRIKGVHGQTVTADSITPDTKDGKYEVVARSENILLDKAQEKNITLTYRHYQYAVTTQGDAGVASLTGAGTYDKGDNAQVSFTLKEGYQVKSVTDNVTDNGTDVTDQAKSGTYDITSIDKNHAVVVTTEKIKYTLTVQYVFPEGEKPATGFENYNVSLDYGTRYDPHVEAVAAPAGYTRTDSGNTTGVITGNTTVLFLYVPNGNATVNVYYQREDDHMSLLPPKSQSGRIGTSFDVNSWKIDSITDGGKIYDLVDGAEHGKGAVMTGEYKLGGTNIYLYYTERAKANITIKYQSEDVNKATFTKPDYTAQGYLNTQYNISGTTYLPETITETLADGSTRTWYYSGSDQLVPGKEALTGTLTGDITVVAKYYLKPTYSVTATYTTVSKGDPTTQTDPTPKQTGEVGENVPFDLSKYEVKFGFTSGDYQNDLAVNGKPAKEMPQMEKFGDYAVTLSYKKSANSGANSGVSTTIKHEFRTFLDGVEIDDKTTARDDAVTETWGNTVDMSKFSKAGQAGYEGYTVEKYSAENGQLRAGDKGTITYVRNLVSVVFDLSGGTWNNSLNNVNYNVVKGGSLDKDGQQPIPAPTKDGYNFVRWVAQPDNAVTTGKFDQRTVFTAEWTPKAPTIVSYFYTVTYNYTVTTDGTVTYQDSETTQVQDTTKASQTINASATASHGGYTFDLASSAEQTADLTGTTREAPHQFVVNYVLTVNNNGGGGGRDDRDDDDPKPNPGGDTEIKDDDVPKTDLPEQPVEIPDEDTPKTDLPQAPVDIPDEDTPKADVPKTGDAMGLWVMAAVASGAGLVWLNLTGKKRKDDNG
ncbi:VWA domain-containing protein [Lawsonibacter sp. LCP25S3_F5]